MRSRPAQIRLVKSTARRTRSQSTVAQSTLASIAALLGTMTLVGPWLGLGLGIGVGVGVGEGFVGTVRAKYSGAGPGEDAGPGEGSMAEPCQRQREA